jgi:uncharacterized protein YndB with AHSA1/START domain
MVLKVLIALVVVIAAILIYAYLQPGDFRVERSVVIDASPETIFPYVNDPIKGELWNPFSKEDPNIQRSFGGPLEGVGAHMTWVGNAMAGEGSLTIVESVPRERVKVQLDFKKPFQGTNFGEYTLSMQNEKQTKVTWAMTGKAAFIPRVMCVFVGMDKMMGGQFEKGLATMKALAESGDRLPHERDRE